MGLVKDLKDLKKQALLELEKSETVENIDEIRQDYFGRKEGKLNNILKQLKDLSGEEKKEAGSLANEIKQELQSALLTKKTELEQKVMQEQIKKEWIDVTIDKKIAKSEDGTIHPHTRVDFELQDLFTSLGFMIYDGPELDSDYYNFQSLNIPEDHPARDMQDTLYIKDHPHWVMRTHTSGCQARIMQQYGAPVRAVYYGKTFRNEATDARHEHTFYQFEALMVDEHIDYSHLKFLLDKVAKGLFGPKVETRFNPKFYPFVEPGFSGDVTCILCEGKGCNVCKNSGWLEFFGAGMVHPEVLRAGNIDPTRYKGVAFGLGSSRMTMLKYGITDARTIQSGDLRFLKQF